MSLIYCPECGTQVSEHAEACGKCAYPIAKLNFKQTAPNNFVPSNNPTTSNKIDFGDLDYSYQQEFEEIYNSDESYKGRWNWFAFLFTWIWCFTKGLWGYAIIILITAIIFSLFSPISSILFSVFVCVLMGVRGTWFYYNVKVKSKQFPN